MTVSTIASIAAGLSRTTGSNSAQTATLVKSLLTASTAPQPQQDSTNLTAALSLQNQVAQFRIASQNLAQASAILAAADAGVSDIQNDLSQLDTLTQKAATVTDTAERAALKSQFDAIVRRIDQRAGSTRFNNESLLSGASPQLKLASENAALKDLSIGSLNTQALFKGGLPDISTATGVKTALDQLKEAKAYTAKQRETIKALEKGLDLASSSLQTAIQNQEAARSTFEEGDLVSALLGGNNGSLVAQTGNLPGDILQLLKE